MSVVMRLARLGLTLVVLALAQQIVAQQKEPQSVPPSATSASPGTPVSATSPSATPPPTASPAATPVEPPSPLREALLLYRKGDFDAAISKYQQLLSEKQSASEAYAGLIRSHLKKKDVEQAREITTKALAEADSPRVRVAAGELYFREGRIHDAEQEWVNVINSGHAEAHAYLGLARVRGAISMYKSAWTMIDKAHALDPTDPEIQRLWVQKVSRNERIRFLEGYLAGENNEDAEARLRLQHYLDYLKARAKDPHGACHLVSKITTTETPLVRLLRDPTHLRAYGLTVDVNGHKSKLMLDTGASGILINRNLAEKSGVTRLSDMPVWGIGDKGDKSGYAAVADSLRIGELEFQGCTVRVLEQRSVADEDGLIGADVFSSFLVDLDFPNEKLQLKELPKRPEETSTAIALKTDEDEEEAEKKSADSGAGPAPSKDAKPAYSGPQDRYIAPEMSSYARIFRFGHMLLVPTSIGDVPNKLFLLDSGAFTNFIAPSAAREVTKVHQDSHMRVKGLSGTVNNVYSADKAVLQFGHIRQENQDMLSFDFTHTSNSIGTEVSGALGFTLLRMLEVKIDYRDGLVDFTYDAKRWGR